MTNRMPASDKQVLGWVPSFSLVYICPVSRYVFHV